MLYTINFATIGVRYYILNESIASCCFMGNGRNYSPVLILRWQKIYLSSFSSLIFSFGEGLPSNSFEIAAALSRITFSISTATLGFFSK